MLVALAAVAITIPFLIPVDTYRPLVEWAIRSSTGRNVHIDALKLSVFPSLRIRLIGVHLKNPPGFPAGDALAADAIDLVVGRRALLERQLVIADIVPTGVRINVLRDAAGHTNFSPAAPAAAPGARPKTGAAPALTLEPIPAISVSNGEITFADAPGRTASSPSFALTHVGATIGAIDPHVQWTKHLDIRLALRGARLTTSLLAQPLAFESGDAGYANGRIRAAFAGTLGDVHLSGDAAIAFEPFNVRFALRSPAVDLATLPRLLHGGTTPGAASSSSRVLASGTIAIGDVRFAPIDVHDLTGQLNLYAGAAHLSRVTAQIFGGSIRGNVAIAAKAGIPVAAGAQLRGINVPSALATLHVGANITGTLDADMQLTTRLAQDPLRRLVADGTFTVRNGTLPGFNVSGDSAQAAQLLGIRMPSGPTRFSSLGGDLRIANERGTSRQLRLVATEMTATASGSFGFNRTVNYAGSALLDAHPTLPTQYAGVLGPTKVRAPFTLRGNADHPQFAMAGSPQVIVSPNALPAAASAIGLPSTIQDLLKLLP